MRKLLGQTGYSWNKKVVVQDNQITLPDTTTEIDNVFTKISNVIKSVYPSDYIVDEGDAVHVNFVKYGSVYSLIKDTKGLYLKVTQPVYHKDLEQLKERYFYIIPYLDGKTYDIDSSNSLVNLYFKYQNSYTYVYIDWRHLKNYYSGQENFENTLSLSYKSTYQKLGRIYTQKSNDSGLNVFKDVFVKLDSFDINGTEFNFSFSISLSLFEELIVIDYRNRIDFKPKANLNKMTFVISPEYDNSSDGYDSAEEALNDGGESIELTDKHGENKAYSQVEIGEFGGTLDSLVPFDVVFELKELSSITEPKYKINLISGNLKDAVGKVSFVLNTEEGRYEIFMVSGIEEDEEGNQYVIFDNYTTFNLSDTTIYGFCGVAKDFAFRYKNTGSSESETKGELLDSYVVLNEYIKLLDLSVVNFGTFEYLENIVTTTGEKLSDIFAFVKDKVILFGENFDTIIPIPLFPVSQEEYNKTPYKFNSLSYDIVDDIPNIAVLKPTLLGTEHPNKSGYVIVAKVPNLYGIDIKSQLKYTPSKIFVNAGDKVVSKDAYVGTYVKDSDKYAVYAVLGLIKGATKPFKVIEF